MTAAGRVVVLGGSGFVGSAILAALACSGYHPVSAQRRQRNAGDGVEQQSCDATDEDSVIRVLQGARAVVNAVRGDAGTMIAATRAAAAAARRHDLLAVHLSSIAVYGVAQGSVGEAAPMRGAGRYARAKIACESILAGTSATILRPGIVYGPGDEQWTGRIFRLLRAHRLGDLGDNGDGYCNLIHARDVGAAVVACLERPAACGQAINLGDDVPPSWNEVFVAGARAIGAVPVARIARWCLAAEVGVLAPPLHLARLSTAWLGVRAAWLPEAITPSMRALFSQGIRLDHTRADTLLGLVRTPAANGLAECAAWFLETYGLPLDAALT